MWQERKQTMKNSENVHNIVCSKSNDSGSKSELVLVVECSLLLAEAHHKLLVHTFLKLWEDYLICTFYLWPIQCKVQLAAKFNKLIFYLEPAADCGNKVILKLRVLFQLLLTLILPWDRVCIWYCTWLDHQLPTHPSNRTPFYHRVSHSHVG